MQTDKVDATKQIGIAVKTGKVSFGVKEALEAAQFGKARLFILASNCHEEQKSSITRYAKQSFIPFWFYTGNSIDLGAACGKPFAVAVLTIKEPGDSEVVKLAER